MKVKPKPMARLRAIARAVPLVIRLVGLVAVVIWQNIRHPGFADDFSRSLRQQRRALDDFRAARGAGRADP